MGTKGSMDSPFFSGDVPRLGLGWLCLQEPFQVPILRWALRRKLQSQACIPEYPQDPAWPWLVTEALCLPQASGPPQRLRLVLLKQLQEPAPSLSQSTIFPLFSLIWSSHFSLQIHNLWTNVLSILFLLSQKLSQSFLHGNTCPHH
jgi:hypothetical protein